MTSSQDNVRLPVGKLPADLLAGLLRQVRHDPRVLVGPKVGADAAVLDWGDRVLIATSDPVTFATDLIGWYAVQVNANDVACLGGTPRWFLATAAPSRGEHGGAGPGGLRAASLGLRGDGRRPRGRPH